MNSNYLDIRGEAGYQLHANREQYTSQQTKHTLISRTTLIFYYFKYMRWQLLNVHFLLLTVSQNIYLTSSIDLQTAKSKAMPLNLQFGDGLDFHCILYQAECVVNLIIWFSMAPHAKSIWNKAEIDCVCKHR